MGSRKKIFLWFFASGFVLLAGLYFALLYIQSSYLKSQILPKVIQSLEQSAPIKLKIGDLKINLFRGLVLEDLVMNYESKEIVSNLKIQSFSVRYSPLSLLSDDFIIDSVDLSDVEVFALLSLPNVPEKASNENPLQKLGALLSTLPKGILLKKLSLSPLQLNLNLQQGERKVEVKFSKASVKADLQAKKDGVGFNFSLDLPRENQEVMVREGGQATPIAFSPSLQFALAARLEAVEKTWVLKLPRIEGKFGIEHLRASEKLPELSMTMNFKLEAESDGARKLLAKDSVGLQISPFKFKGLEFQGAEIESSGDLDLEKKLVHQEIKSKLKGLVTGFEEQIPFGLFEKGAHLNAKLVLSDRFVEVQELSAGNEINTLRFSTSGRLDSDLQNLSVKGEAEVRGGEESDQISGEIRIPWTFSRQNAKTLGLKSRLQAKNFSASSPSVKIKGFNADIPMEMEFELKPHELPRFTYVLTRNPFERVDFSTIQPYLVKSGSRLSIEKIGFRNLEVGPLYARAEIHQNFIMSDDYQLELFGGTMTGKFFVDTYPGNRRLGVLARLSGLNPKALRGEKLQESDRRISSRVAVVYHFDKSLAEGRLDVTEIGGPQLIELIRFVDPQFQNSKLNLARSLLKFSHPRYVGLFMSQGFLDLSVDMGGVVSLSDLGVQGISLTPVVSMMKQDFLNQFSKGVSR
jgi:hypothetical protein